MVRHTGKTNAGSKNDLSKIKFKPGKYLTVSTSKIIALKETSSNMEANKLMAGASTSTCEAFSSNEILTPNSPLLTNVPISKGISLMENVSNAPTLKSALKINVPTEISIKY